MKSGDKKRVGALDLLCYLTLLRVKWVERKTNKWVLDKIRYVLILRMSMAEREMRCFGHIFRTNSMEKESYRGRWKAKGQI